MTQLKHKSVWPGDMQSSWVPSPEALFLSIGLWIWEFRIYLVPGHTVEHWAPRQVPMLTFLPRPSVDGILPFAMAQRLGDGGSSWRTMVQQFSLERTYWQRPWGSAWCSVSLWCAWRWLKSKAWTWSSPPTPSGRNLFPQCAAQSWGNLK